MAVSTTNAFTGPYLTNGVTRVFPFNFTAPSADEVAVVLRDSAGVESNATGFSVTISGSSGGSVSFVTPPADGYALIVALDTFFTQDLAFENGSPFLADPVNEGYDRSALRDQVLKRDVDRGLKVPLGEQGLTFPSAGARSGGALGFDFSGNLIVFPEVPEFGDGYIDYPFDLDAGDTQIMIPEDARGSPLAVLINFQEIKPDVDYTQSETIVTLLHPANDGDEGRLRVAVPAVMMQASADQIRVRRSGLSAAQYRTLSARSDDRFDYRDMLGYDLSGSHGQVSTMAAALNESAASGDALNIPTGVIVLDDTVSWPGRAKLVGYGTTPYLTKIDAKSRGPGSWFQIAHEGVGISMGDGGALTSGVSIKGVGTFRQQPAITSGWEPVDHDFDIVVNNADVELDDIMLLNATRGIKQKNGQAGRLTIGRLRGQPMIVGLEVEQSLDIMKAELIHFWPFWANLDAVHAFTLQNLDAVRLYRADGPHIDTLFSIFAKSTLRISQNSYGKTTGGKIDQIYCDAHGAAGLVVDSNVDAAILQVSLMNSQGNDAVPATRSILIDGDNCQIDIGQHRSQKTGAEAVRTTGAGNNLRIGLPAVANYNQDGAGFSAYVAGISDTITLSSRPIVSGDNNDGALYGGTGAIIAPDRWTTIVPSVTSETGAISSLGEYYLKFRQSGDLIEAYGKIVITNAGTAGGALLVQSPFVSIDDASGSGRQVVGGTAKICSVTLGAGGSSVAITGEGNSSPIATGATVTFNIRYRV